jgi:hypothetical protein
MANRTITIEREGSFSARVTHSRAKQCGSYGTDVFRFRVKITGKVNRLNKNGWLLDNNDIPAYFKRVYSKGVRDLLSCERVVQDACIAFATFCHQNGSIPEKIEVGIQGIAGSWITCTWEA